MTQRAKILEMLEEAGDKGVTNYQLKICNGCSTFKETTEFYVTKKGTLNTPCKVCTREKTRLWRLANPERSVANSRKDYQKNRAKRLQQVKEYRAKNYVKASLSHIKKLYGLTPDQYHELLEIQDGKCSLCRRLPRGFRNERRLVVDHDHETGHIRGLLCINCNSGLAQFKDNREVLKRAGDYVAQYDWVEEEKLHANA